MTVGDSVLRNCSGDESIFLSCYFYLSQQKHLSHSSCLNNFFMHHCVSVSCTSLWLVHQPSPVSTFVSGGVFPQPPCATVLLSPFNHVAACFEEHEVTSTWWAAFCSLCGRHSWFGNCEEMNSDLHSVTGWLCGFTSWGSVSTSVY
jgi:hypothetical protein